MRAVNDVRSNSPFSRDKAALLAAVLDRYGVRYRHTATGNQKVRCLNKSAHPGGDRNPSASVRLGAGLYNCFACGLSGDGYDIMLEIEGMKATQVNEALKPGVVKEESDWI